MLKNSIREDIEKNLGEPMKNVKEIQGGLNNRLYKITTSNNDYLLKIYGKGADIMLNREFNAFKYLKENNIDNVPHSYFKSIKLGFALYSFESGITKKPSQITKGEIREMAKFVARVHKLKPNRIREKFLPANFACFSINDYIKNIYFRLDKFAESSHSKDAPSIIKKLKSEKVDLEIKKLIKIAISRIPRKHLNKKLTLRGERLSPVDFGVHNILVKKDGSLCFIDFEYFGRDDPVRAVADFLMHDRSLEIPMHLKQDFQQYYLNYVTADEEYKKRLELVKKIIDIEWLAIYLYSMTSEKIKIRSFANSCFDVDVYLSGQSTKLYKRLNKIRTEY